MKTLTITLVLSGLLLATSGCATRRMYEGAKQPSRSLAYVKALDHARVLSIDGRVVPQGDQRDTWLSVLPGDHDVEVTSWEYEYRSLDQTNGTRYVGRVLMVPERPVLVKTTLRAGSHALVRYQRVQDTATFTCSEKETGEVVGSMTTRLVGTPAPRPVYYYDGPIFIGPPPPMIWVPIGPPPPHFHP